MKFKLLIIFLFILILPLTLLLGIGLKWSQDEQKIIQNQINELNLQKLQLLRQTVDSFIQNEQKELHEFLSSINEDKSQLRDLIRKSPKVSQLFILDSKGGWSYPSPAMDDLSENERQFLERSDKRLYQKIRQMDFQAGEVQRSSQLGIWSSYFWNNQMVLIYSEKTAENKIIGIELNRINFISRLMSVFPDTPQNEKSKPFRISFNDSQGNIFYQWGSNKGTPKVKLNLSSPLDSMELTYYSEEENPGRSFRFNFFSGLGFLVVSLLGMGFYFYRENAREIREAEKRVTFVNLVSHELKTPLTNIRMYSELLEQYLDETDEKSSQYLKVLVSESERLSRLIGNVLSFAKKEKNQLKLRKNSGSIKKIIEKSIEQFSLSLKEKGIEVVFTSQEDSLVELDEDLVLQIIGNLISNVEKYAPLGKVIKIEHRKEGERSVVTVSDEGPGIPKEKREKIFEPFFRLANQLTAGATGTGIGLTIARDLARLHGGDLVLVDSEKGASFQLTILTPEIQGD